MLSIKKTGLPAADIGGECRDTWIFYPEVKLQEAAASIASTVRNEKINAAYSFLSKNRIERRRRLSPTADANRIMEKYRSLYDGERRSPFIPESV